MERLRTTSVKIFLQESQIVDVPLEKQLDLDDWFSDTNHCRTGRSFLSWDPIRICSSYSDFTHWKIHSCHLYSSIINKIFAHAATF